MTDRTPDFQSIEDAYGHPVQILGQLPHSEDRETALHHLRRSQEAAYQAREKTRDQEAPCDAS